MKQIKKINAMAFLALLAGGMLTACTNELKAPGNSGISGIPGSPVISVPDVVAWTGNQTLGNTFTGNNYTIAVPAMERANQEAPYNGHKPHDITEHEVEAVLEYFRAHQGREDAVEVDFSNFYVQQVYYDDGPYNAVNGSSYTAKNCVVEIAVHHGGQHSDNVFSGNDEFNKCRYLSNSTTLDFWYNNSACSFWSNNLKMVYIPDYGYYVGFDVEGQPDKAFPANGNMHLTNSPDGWFYDRIIKVVPATGDGTPLAPTDDNFPLPPGLDDDDDDDEGDTGSGDNGSTGKPDDSQDTDDDQTTVTPTGKEVEVNLALNDIHTLPNGTQKYDIADLVSKLSIHVRYPKDVEVVIPVPEKFYCDQDDLYILNTHTEGNYTYGGESHTLNYILGDNDEYNVTLTVEFVGSGSDNVTATGLGYIRVYTEGIGTLVDGKTVIDYCQTNFGDGINFEVYNYYNRGNQYSMGSFEEIDYFTLQYDYLSRSSVIFDWNDSDGTFDLPEFFINAFNQIGGKPNQGDCYVWIKGDEHVSDTYSASWWSTQSQSSSFWTAYQGTHYNSSPLNWIYTNKSVQGSVNPTVNAMPVPTWPFNGSPYQSFRFNGNDNYTFE